MVASYVVVLFLLIELLISGAEALSMDYYMMSCPFMDQIVSNTVNQALRQDPTLAAGLLRLHFHDCFVQVNHHVDSSYWFSPFCPKDT